MLPLKNRPNRGEVEMYYISNTHAPAIDRELFGAVQEMLKRNMQKKAKCAIVLAENCIAVIADGDIYHGKQR